MFSCPATEDFFRARLDHMIDLRHPLCVLSSRMPWQQIEASVSHLFMRKARTDVAMPDLDLFGEAPAVTGRASNAGRPRVPLRLMIALLYLKHAFNESDEGVVERWGETPTWQFFSGQAHFEHRRPCDATTLVKFRKLLGDEGVEELLAQTINAAVEMKLIAKSELSRVIVDSTVQQKAIAHPTDSRLLEVARDKLVQAAKDAGIPLKQTFVKEGKQLSHKAGRYAHAKQWRRMHKAIGRQRTVLGRLAREVERKANGQNNSTSLHTAHHTPIAAAVQQALSTTLERAQRIWAQTAAKKNRDGKGKLYAFHAPEVECIGKGKSRQPYEFGVKVGIASTLRHNLIVGAKAFPGNPYDGHTLNAQLEQATILMQDNQAAPSDVFVDLGYRGVDGDNPTVAIKHRGKFKSLSASDKRMLKRRQAIEPIIGHLKQDHRLDRCHLKGEVGDRLHAVLCAAGYNIKWLLRMIAKKGVSFAKHLFLRLFGHEYRNDVQRLRTAVDTVNHWLANLSLSQTSAMPLRLAANSDF
jgi:IS5 family transposase